MNLKKPDISGIHADIWKLVPRRTKPDHEAHICSYLIKSNKFHLMWDRWILELIHLRDIPNVRPAIITDPGSTHQIIVLAIDPKVGVIDIDNPKNIKFLRPIDQQVQFEVPDDVSALSLIEEILQEICNGRLSPDQDYRNLWYKIVKQTSAHYRGEHVSNN